MANPQEPNDVEEAVKLNRKIEKYGQRFTMIYRNIAQKERVENHILNESLAAAYISCQLSTIIHHVSEQGGTPEDVENMVKSWLHVFRENAIAQAEIAVNQILEAQAVKQAVEDQKNETQH